MSNLKTVLIESFQQNTADNQTRLILEDAKKQTGYASTLLEITQDQDINQNMRQLASTQLGNFLESHWKFQNPEQAKKIVNSGSEFIIIEEDEKKHLRDNIIMAMFKSQDSLISKQYERCVSTLANQDYPKLWPELLQDIEKALESGNMQGWLTGLKALLMLVKKYQFSNRGKRELLNQAFTKTFDILTQINLVNTICQDLSEQNLSVIYLICKVFYASNSLELLSYLRDEKKLRPWIEFFKHLMKMEVPNDIGQSTQNMDEIARNDRHQIWRIKGLVGKLTFSLLQQFTCTEKKGHFQSSFIQGVNEAFSHELLEVQLKVLFRRKTAFCGTKALAYSIRFIKECVESGNLPLMEILKPNVNDILYEIAMPILCLSQKDVEDFYKDSVEFIRTQENLSESLFMPRIRILELIDAFLTYNTAKAQVKWNNLQKNQDKELPRGTVPDYLVEFLNNASNKMSDLTQQQNSDFKTKEALMYILGYLQAEIQKYDHLWNSMEAILETQIKNELQSSEPFLRYRACWVYGKFVNVKFQENHIAEVMEQIYKNLINFDMPLPVRLEAALTITKFLGNDLAENMLKPLLGNLIEAYLNLMNEVDSEYLADALQSLMQVFSEDIMPFAEQAITKLAATYQNHVEAMTSTDLDIQSEAILAGSGCIQAIRRVVESVQSNPKKLRQVQNLVMNILIHGLKFEGIEIAEEVYDMISIFAYHTEPNMKISTELWNIYPQMLIIICGSEGENAGFAIEHISEAVCAMQNFISKDKETFQQMCPFVVEDFENQPLTYLRMTLIFTERMLRYENKDETHQINVLKTILALLENIDCSECMQEILDQLQSIQHENSKTLTQQLMCTYAMCFFNAPATTYQILTQTNALQIRNLKDKKQNKNQNQKMNFDQSWLTPQNQPQNSNSNNQNYIRIAQKLQNLAQNFPNSLQTVFMTWFECMDNFKHDFEMRRIIFGLAGVVKLISQNYLGFWVVKGNPASIPDLVKQRVGSLGLQMSKLVVRMGCERERIIKKHRVYIQNDGNEEKIKAQMMQEDKNENMKNKKQVEIELYKNLCENPEENDNNFLQFLKQKVDLDNENNIEPGQPKTSQFQIQIQQEENSDEEDSDFESESSDEEGDEENYEALAGDEDLYNSGTSQIDELIHLREILGNLPQDMSGPLFSQIPSDQMQKMQEILNSAESLKQQQDECLRGIEEIERRYKKTTKNGFKCQFNHFQFKKMVNQLTDELMQAVNENHCETSPQI